MPLSTWIYIVGGLFAAAIIALGRYQQAQEKIISDQNSQIESSKVDKKMTAILDSNSNPEPAAQIVIEERKKAWRAAKSRRSNLNSNNIDDKLSVIGDELTSEQEKYAAIKASIPSKVLKVRKHVDPIVEIAVEILNEKITRLEASGHARKGPDYTSNGWKGVSAWQIQPPIGGYAKNGEKFKPAIDGGFLGLTISWKYGSDKTRFVIKPMLYPDNPTRYGWSSQSGKIFGIDFSEDRIAGIPFSELETDENRAKLIALIESQIDKEIEKSLVSYKTSKDRGVEPNF